MKVKIFLLAIVTMFATVAIAQTVTEPTIFRISSAYTSFPDTARANGHNYNNVLYTTAEHYNDSSVLIIIPPGLTVKKNIDLVFWFHGWKNNIDSVPARYNLIKQFVASHRNTVLVLAETAKNAPDSYGDKLEQKGVFKLLVADVLHKLKAAKTIGKNVTVGNIMLRAIAAPTG